MRLLMLPALGVLAAAARAAGMTACVSGARASAYWALHGYRSNSTLAHHLCRQSVRGGTTTARAAIRAAPHCLHTSSFVCSPGSGPGQPATFQVLYPLKTVTLHPDAPARVLTPLSGRMLLAPRPGPTRTSNWIIPDSILLAAHPDVDDVPALTAAGVTTYVSLVGEYNTHSLLTSQYPHHLPPTAPVDVIHFPIPDYGIPAAEDLASLISALIVRARAGHIILLHCRAGLGRTGTVAIPLVAILGAMDLSTARALVETGTAHTRASLAGRKRPVEMPETAAQFAVAEAAHRALLQCA
eukprot:m.7441 g.7441  ORF g.7441 m.7441 type:complete len:298 (-) comp2193_c0_seq1:241-1134(-)